MSLADGKPIFVNGLVALQKEMLTKEGDSFQHFAEQMAQLIEDFIKSAKVQPGQTVTTAGTATNQTGQTTTKGNIE
ncbi:hypothetical protein [Amniculibacterium sp. G2-70]|uniref:hypothetical protein n=1 Tax=Amniculibacterium sp. G2-70 TaxID=2767188 RepID=UPI0016543A16|nr:hypothetical protein [Amniculibacterium sp. G2-70]